MICHTGEAHLHDEMGPPVLVPMPGKVPESDAGSHAPPPYASNNLQSRAGGQVRDLGLEANNHGLAVRADEAVLADGIRRGCGAPDAILREDEQRAQELEGRAGSRAGLHEPVSARGAAVGPLMTGMPLGLPGVSAGMRMPAAHVHMVCSPARQQARARHICSHPEKKGAVLASNKYEPTATPVSASLRTSPMKLSSGRVLSSLRRPVVPLVSAVTPNVRLPICAMIAAPRDMAGPNVATWSLCSRVRMRPPGKGSFSALLRVCTLWCRQKLYCNTLLRGMRAEWDMGWQHTANVGVSTNTPGATGLVCTVHANLSPCVG